MAGLSGYEKVVLGLTAGFVLFTGGWFWTQNRSHGDYQVSTMERRQETEDMQASSAVSEEEQPDSLLPGETIDINTADLYELQRLPGIGEKRAEDIIAYREQYGPFQTVDQLDEVSGIGSGILDGLRDYAAVD